MKDKTNINYQYPQSSGCGLGIGCFAVGCVGFIVIFLGLAIGGYYAAMHSSLPLRIMESALEESGEVEIEGLQGSISTGFTADEMRFKTTDEHWSSLNDIRFEYESDSSWFGDSELVIREMSIGSGAIYADFEPEELEFDFDPDFEGELEEFQAEMEEAEREMNVEFDSSFDGFEFRVETVSVSDLKFINPETEFEVAVNKIRFKDFSFKNGKIASIGELVVDSTQLDVETTEPVHLMYLPNSQRYEGTMKQAADHRLLKDVPFSVEFGITDEFQVRMIAEAFGGEMAMTDTKKEYHVVYDDFSFNNWVDDGQEPALFSNIRMKIDFNRDKRGPVSISPDASVKFGASTFTNFKIVEPETGSRYIVGESELDSETVRLVFTLPTPFAQWQNVRLDTDDQETWSQVLFDKNFDQLDEAQLSTLRKAMAVGSNVEDSETVESDDAEEAVAVDTAEEAATPEDSESADDATESAKAGDAEKSEQAASGDTSDVSDQEEGKEDDNNVDATSESDSSTSDEENEDDSSENN